MQAQMNLLSKQCPTREQQLLLACSRTDLTPEVKAAIDDLMHQSINWTSLLELAQKHGVLPMLYHSLVGVNSTSVSREILDALQLRFLANATHNVVFVRELFQVLDLLNSMNITAVPLKGPLLAAQAYGNVSLRQFSDLDILVHREDVRKAKELLTSEGYVNNFGLTSAAEDALISYQKDFQFVSPGRGIIIELHWALEPGRRFRSFNDEKVWERLIEAELDGRKVCSLCPEDSLLYLCLHGANHRWDRLCWICDAAQTIKRWPGLDWGSVVEEARALHCQRILYLGVALARTFLDAPVPAQVARTAMSYPDLDKLMELVTAHLFASPEHGSEIRRSFSFHLMVRESLWHKVQLWARRVLLPDALDFRASKFPPSLFFLLPLFRPLRLLAKHVPAHMVPPSWRR